MVTTMLPTMMPAIAPILMPLPGADPDDTRVEGDGLIIVEIVEKVSVIVKLDDPITSVVVKTLWINVVRVLGGLDRVVVNVEPPGVGVGVVEDVDDGRVEDVVDERVEDVDDEDSEVLVET